MPHKHKRRHDGTSDDHDLPPSAIAKPLPTRVQSIFTSKKDKQSKKAKQKKTNGNEYPDDTPKEFARLMRKFQSPQAAPDKKQTETDNKRKSNRKRKRGEQQDGTGKQRRESKTPKKEQPAATTTTTPSTTSEAHIPKILPGERLADFSARVDHALPLSGITRKAAAGGTSKLDAEIRNLRENRQTKHEKRLRRLQKEWREEEVKIREREEAAREEREAEDEEVNDRWKEWEVEAGSARKKGGKKKNSKKAKKKAKRAGGGKGGEESDDSGENEEDEADPWAKLNQKRRVGRSSNPFDVVQAPPEKLTKVREKFKVRGMDGARVEVADVPVAAGSLRRREELASERQSIVEEYRRLMANKRGE